MPIITPGRDWLRDHPDAADALLAVGILVLFVSAISPGGFEYFEGQPLSLVVAVAVAGVLPVAVRRRWPWAAAVGLCVVMLAGTALGLVTLTEGVSVLVVVYTVAALLPLRQAVGASLLVWAAGSVVIALSEENSLGVWFSNALTLLVCFFIGRTVFTRRAYVDALEERARAAEETRETAALQAVLEERRRIARELHDVVAHHISVMGVLATGARRTLGRDPAAADEALSTIEATGRATLREMRRLLDVLRSDDESDASLQPQPGVAGLETLVAQVREAGLDVQLRVVGEPRALDPGVDLTIFRIVQEGLTNALKHAGPASAEVRVEFRGDRLLLDVEDNGRGEHGTNGHTGHGLVGMRERISLYGGTLRTGSRRGGGYSVAASIPLDPASEQPITPAR
jgi:signal transduction histidine kinase